MASVTKQRIGKYTYLYESVSYRDKLGRPRNKKDKIGKINQYTGKTNYTPDGHKMKNDLRGLLSTCEAPEQQCIQ